jgi:hypothetical protein
MPNSCKRQEYKTRAHPIMDAQIKETWNRICRGESPFRSRVFLGLGVPVFGVIGAVVLGTTMMLRLQGFLLSPHQLFGKATDESYTSPDASSCHLSIEWVFRASLTMYLY